MIVDKEDLIIIDPSYIPGLLHDSDNKKLDNKINGIISETYIGKGSWNVYEKINNKPEDNLEEELDNFISNLEDKQNQFIKSKTRQSLKELDKLKIQQRKIGEIKVDSGIFGVFSLNDILCIYPNFLTEIDSKLYTLINEFSGKLKIVNNTEKEKTRILGIGNILFFTDYIIINN